jgi:predicted PurR-regulated permease PerM
MSFGQSLGFLSFLISLYILGEIRQLLLLIFCAVIFAVVLNRVVVYLKRFHFSRWTAVFCLILIIIIVVNLLFIVILPPFIEQFQSLLKIVPKVNDKINELINLINNLDDSEYYYFRFFKNLDSFIDNYSFVPDNLVDSFIAFFSNVVFVLSQIIFVFVLTIVFLLNPSQYRYYIRQLCPSFYRTRLDDILDKSEIAIVNWLSGILISSICIGILTGIGLSVLQIKFVFVHAFLAGLLNLIPNIGPTASVVFPLMIAVVDAPWKIVPIIIWYFIIQNIESYFLTPKLMAEKTSLLPAVTLFAQIFFATMFGVLGLLLALPLTVVAKTWIEEILFQDILDQWTID